MKLCSFGLEQLPSDWQLFVASFSLLVSSEETDNKSSVQQEDIKVCRERFTASLSELRALNMSEEAISAIFNTFDALQCTVFAQEDTRALDALTSPTNSCP
ncbi:hypothetical protein EON63_07875 [archaeon]|nr:MAG: hypothetical protein EON63_07875 [archaeon]